MYEGGHDLDGSGTIAQKVSAQRAYFNFVLLAGITKNVKVTSTVPATGYAKDKLNVSATSSSGTGPYTFKWTSQLGATFSSSTQATSLYHVPDVSTASSDVVTVTVTDNCNRVDFVTKTIAIATTLPIKLKSFKAYGTKNGVNVEWVTASEINNDNFSIERSKDGVNYSEVGKVRGAGNSTVILEYSFIDEHPFRGTSYYRLKQTDYDGKSETFNPVSVNIKEEQNEINAVHVFPNPFSESFTATFESLENKEVEIQLLSFSGTTVSSEKAQAGEGKNTYRFTAPSDLKTGIYIFRILNGSTVLANTKVFCRKY